MVSIEPKFTEKSIIVMKDIEKVLYKLLIKKVKSSNKM